MYRVFWDVWGVSGFGLTGFRAYGFVLRVSGIGVLLGKVRLRKPRAHLAA